MTAAYVAVVASSVSVLAEDMQAKPNEKSKTATLDVHRVLTWDGLIAMMSIGTKSDRPPRTAALKRFRIPSFRASLSRLWDLKYSFCVRPEASRSPGHSSGSLPVDHTIGSRRTLSVGSSRSLPVGSSRFLPVGSSRSLTGKVGFSRSREASLG